MFGAILNGIFVMVLAMAAASALHRGATTVGGGTRPNFFANIRNDGWIHAISFGVLAALTRWLAPISVRWVSWAAGFTWVFPAIMLVVMVALMIHLIRWWCDEGSEVRELVWFILLALMLTFVTKIAAVALASLIASAFLASVILTLPWVLFTYVVGRMLWDILSFRAEHENEDVAGIYKALSYIAVLIAALIAFILIVMGVDWSALKPTKAEVMEPAPEVQVSWYRFCHYDLLKDTDISDDFNFGPELADTDGTPEAAKKEHYARVEKDPALGVATFANFDVRLGTDFLERGHHYDSNESDGKWTTRINERIAYYMAHEDEYNVAVGRWEKFVDKYTTVTLTQEKGLTDQMYMISYGSEDEAPEVIIAETDQPDGWMLSYNFLIKGNDFKVPFRTNCGFQPTNVAEPMKETPKENPSNPL